MSTVNIVAKTMLEWQAERKAMTFQGSGQQYAKSRAAVSGAEAIRFSDGKVVAFVEDETRELVRIRIV